MKVTFLEAANGLQLTKHYGKAEVRPYPYVKEVTSQEEQVTKDFQGLMDLEALIRARSSRGACMLKGGLKRQLVQESRAGKADRRSYTDFLVLDFDNVKLPMSLSRSNLTATDVERVAEYLVAQLPIPLRSVSYIAQASSSFGMKSDRVSIHIFMLMSVPIPPKTLKLWLINTNCTVDLFKDQLQLSANGQSLKYPLDTSLADNSKLIFIATPTFDDPADNPFTTDDDRIVLVQRQHATVDIAAEMAAINPEVTHQRVQALKDELRTKAGIKKQSAKIKTLSIDNQNQDVLMNPDKMSINIVDTSASPYIRCNINGGDSGAYYFNLDRPQYMYNFKDEPIFEIEKADREFYKALFDTFESYYAGTGKALRPVVMRDYHTDIYYNGVFDPNLNQFSDQFPLVPTSKGSVDGFMRSHGQAPPDFIPDAEVVFDPSSKREAVNLSTMPFYVNMYRRTKYVMEAKTPPVPLSFGEAFAIDQHCPLITKLVLHILGDGKEEFERFVNWLAYIYQNKKKAKTAWVLGGVPGTGKGLFYSKVLRPLFGEEHVPMRAIQNIEEQYNLYMRQALFLIVDEFHMASASRGTITMADKLKNQITEDTITIRAMRSNQNEMPSYTNYIFLTNRPDAIKIEQGDRRYNIPPRQERKLDEAHPDVIANIDRIENELYHFAGYLQTFKVDERLVRVCIDNTAKEQMRHVSMSVFEEFCQALKDGDISFFADILEITPSNVMQAGEISTAQRFVKGWIAEAKLKDKYSIIPAEHLRTIYHVQTEQNPRLSQREFTKRLSRNNIEVTRKRHPQAGRDSNPIRGILVDWTTDDLELQRLINDYFEDGDQALLQAKNN
jgi:hypothetical protein